MNIIFLPLAVSGIDLALYMALSGLAAGVFFGGLGMYFHHRRQTMWHETARIALEKGQPVPPAPDAPPWNEEARATTAETIRGHRIRGYLIGGLINIAVGSGLYLALAQFSPATAYFAAIPGFIGVALILAAAIEVLMGRANRK